jgi:hypothetical protein
MSMVRLPAVTHRVPYGVRVQGALGHIPFSARRRGLPTRFRELRTTGPNTAWPLGQGRMFEVGRGGEQEESWAADRVSPQGPLRPRPAAPHSFSTDQKFDPQRWVRDGGPKGN